MGGFNRTVAKVAQEIKVLEGHFVEWFDNAKQEVGRMAKVLKMEANKVRTHHSEEFVPVVQPGQTPPSEGPFVKAVAGQGEPNA